MLYLPFTSVDTTLKEDAAIFVFRAVRNLHTHDLATFITVTSFNQFNFVVFISKFSQPFVDLYNYKNNNKQSAILPSYTNIYFIKGTIIGPVEHTSLPVLWPFMINEVLNVVHE